jgi:hypothetical protein
MIVIVIDVKECSQASSDALEPRRGVWAFQNNKLLVGVLDDR